ncbi:MAG: hypothetical protein WC247_09960 [Porticoccaceae bacterium]
MSANDPTEVLAAGRIILPGATLATPEQRLLEERAIAICRRAEIAAARARIEALFKADRNARLAGQDAVIARSAEEHVMHAALIAASETPLSPRFVWTIAMAREWLGLQVPGSRFGQDNPDNVYRFASVDPALSYRISGRFVVAPPTDFSICSLPAQVGEGIAADVRGFIARDTLDVDAAGHFEILVDGTATDGRRNHLSIAGARVLMVRDTLVDWDGERPSWLHIERLDDHTPAAGDGFELERAAFRAADLAVTIASFFLERVQHGMCETGPLNTVPAPVSSAARGGLVSQAATLGYYRLGDDEAWVLTIDRLGARYLGVQICDMWMLSYDYGRRTSSLNHHQALPDDDGRYRLVVSAADPGVHNWLDGSGAGIGTILLRWQGIPADADFASGATAELIKISELRAHLPAETRYLDGKAREEQQARRYRAYRRRLAAGTVE